MENPVGAEVTLPVTGCARVSPPLVVVVGVGKPPEVVEGPVGIVIPAPSLAVVVELDEVSLLEPDDEVEPVEPVEDALETKVPSSESSVVVPSTFKTPLDPKDIVCSPIVCLSEPGTIVVLPRIRTVSSPVATSPEAKVNVS